MSKKKRKRNIPTSFNSYILFNPAYPIEVVFRLLGNKSTEQLIIKGKPEDFLDNPRLVFKQINEKKEITYVKP